MGKITNDSHRSESYGEKAMSEMEQVRTIETRWEAEDRLRHRVDENGCWNPPGPGRWGPGETLRRLRELRGISQGELAWRSGRDQADVSRVEAGRGVCWRTLERLADALECDAVFHLRPRRPLETLIPEGRRSRLRA